MTGISTSGAWVLCPPERQEPALGLFCFPPAGNGAAIYRLWPASLSPEIAVYRIQPPGRETRFREDLITDIDTYVDALLAELLPQLNGPFAFFGHSMGSLIAFRVAQRLRQDYDRVPEHIVVSAFRSPQAPPLKRIFDLPQDVFIQELRDTYGGIPDQLLNEPEVLEATLPIVRADLAVVASHSYKPQAPFSCPISAFGGIDDKWIDEPQLSEWQVHTSSDFELRMFPGNHYYLNAANDTLFKSLQDVLT